MSKEPKVSSTEETKSNESINLADMAEYKEQMEEMLANAKAEA